MTNGQAMGKVRKCSLQLLTRETITMLSEAGTALRLTLLFVLSLTGIAACSTASEPETPASPVEQCRDGEREVPTQTACLQDDASCYQIADGNWCTGPKKPTCPAGSSGMSPGDECPVGARCFVISESLQCVVDGAGLG